MSILSKIFGKKATTAQKLSTAGTCPPPREYGPSDFDLVYENDIVGLRHSESGEIHWLPWGHIQNVQVVMEEPYLPGQYVFDIMAEFDHMDIEWEVKGFHGFFEVMSANLDNFNLAAATIAISQLDRDHPRATIYISPHYDLDIATR
jgi:hypothetical protein